MQKLLCGTIALTCLLASGPGHAAPEQERLELIRFFQERFPGIALEEYVHGALMLSEDATSQYDSIMEFPPFQGEISRGERLWKRRFANGRSFAGCFPNDGHNVAGNYPYYDAESDRVVTFEMAINRCLRENGEAEFRYDDRETMGVLTAYARTLSDGMRLNVRVDSPGAVDKYRAGKAFYYRRIGQLNLACASCHISHAGNYFRDELISPGLGQPAHFPVFRGGENLNTLHMRYQRCMEAMRAVPFAAGSEELNNLEYFHSFISNGLPLRASVYRK
jgi:L-cysteine S-thiosulfotransferase